jgi:hypothetical protein
MTTTIETPVTAAIPAPLRDRFRELALKAANGDASAEAELTKMEKRIAEHERAERRREAAAVEVTRLAAEDEREAAKAARQAEESAYASAMLCKRAAYAQVEDMTTELAEVIKAALIAGDAARAAATRLGYSPGRLPSDEIYAYIAVQLGRDGGAGLGDFPFINPGLRAPLVPKE